MRKTTNYYKERLNAGDTSVIAEVIAIYGANDSFYIGRDTQFVWNHRIDKFSTYKGRICVGIYWQGDSTDGNDGVYLEDAWRGTTIRAEHYFDGNRTYCRHGDITIKRDEVLSAMKVMASKLSDELKKQRKDEKAQANAIKKLTRKAKPYLDIYRSQMEKADKNGYYTTSRYIGNGINAVERAIKEKTNDLLGLDDNSLVLTIDYIFSKNKRNLRDYNYQYDLSFPQ